MAVKLLKAVKREMLGTPSLGKYRNRNVIVELTPGDTLTFRIKGTKTRYEVYLGHCYQLAQIMTIEKMYKEKLQKYKEKKELGLRCKKPKKPFLPFDKILFKALK